MTQTRRLVLCLLLGALLTLPAAQASALTGTSAAGLGMVQTVLVRITRLLTAAPLGGDVGPPATENGQTMDPDG